MWTIVKCEKCGKEIPSPGMSKHIQWHTTEKPCRFCGKPVYGRNKFCSLSCAARENKNRQGTGSEHTCIKCGKKAFRKYCSLQCQADYEYNEYIKQWMAGEVSGGQKNGSGAVSSHVRRWLFERSGSKCEALLDDGSRCGWSRINKHTGKIPLNIHHKDGNSENHRPENLELICPGCHSLTETYGNANKGHGRKGRPGSMKNKTGL